MHSILNGLLKEVPVTQSAVDADWLSRELSGVISALAKRFNGNISHPVKNLDFTKTGKDLHQRALIG